MNVAKRDYFLAALHANRVLEKAWVNSVFGVTDTPKTLKPYDLVRNDQGVHYASPEDPSQLIRISDAPKEGPLVLFREGFPLKPGEIANYTDTKPLTTTYGNAFINYLCLVLPFGTEIPYQTGQISIPKIEGMIYERLTDNPPPEERDTPPPPGTIYVHQYLTFAEHVLSLVGYNSLAVVSVTERSMQGHPDARKLRKELMQRFEGRLSDPAVVAEIKVELENLDKEWLKGDPTEAFYSVNPAKYYGIVRSQLFYLFGGESPFEDGTSVEFVEKSLEEGIDVDHYPTLNNSARYGSYSRGAQTRLGGTSTKTIYRMLGASRITEEDCGSKIGVPCEITSLNATQLVGYYHLKDGVLEELTTENVRGYIGQHLLLRTPNTCKTERRNVCAVCMGRSIAEHPEGLAGAGAEVGGVFLTSFMKLMHGTGLVTQHWDYKQRLS